MPLHPIPVIQCVCGGVLLSTPGREESTWKGRVSQFPVCGDPQLSISISEFSQDRSWPGSTCCALVTPVFLTPEKDYYRALQELFSKELEEVG